MKPDPDFERFRKAVMREGEPDRIPFAELFHDLEIVEAIMGEKMPSGKGREAERAAVKFRIDFWYRMGYDYARFGPGIAFPTKQSLAAQDTATLSRGQRGWTDEAHGAIENRQDFDAARWPKPEEINYRAIEIAASLLPDGMKLIMGTGGVLEHVMWIMGYQPFALAIYDDPELIDDMFEKVGSLLLSAYETCASMEEMGALWLGDDMGFKTQTMISAEALRRWVFPWQKKLADAAHAQGKPFILHACGNLEEVMDDLIDYVGIDAKHSFEDVIMPVAEAKKKYGDRIGIVGGVDVDLLARGSEEQVRQYVRKIIRECGPGGGYCLGSGNSVTNYCKVENFLAMLDEGRKHGSYPIAA